MLNLLQAILLIGTLTLALPAYGQEVVHALTGKIKTINPADKTIQVATDDGSGGLFHIQADHRTVLDFDKDVEALTTPAASFRTTNDKVLVFYYGGDNGRTSVALKDLGAGPLEKVTGTLVKFDKRTREIVVKDNSGAEKTFQLDPKAVADSPTGVVEAEKLDLDKGSAVRVTAAVGNGTETALFVREL